MIASKIILIIYHLGNKWDVIYMNYTYINYMHLQKFLMSSMKLGGGKHFPHLQGSQTCCLQITLLQYAAEQFL